MFVRRRGGTSGKIGGCASARFAKAAGARARAVRSAARNERAARRGTNVQRGEAALLPQTACGGLRHACPRPPISVEVAERAESALPLSSAALVGVRYKSGREKAAVSNFYCPPALREALLPFHPPVRRAVRLG